jgi:hypothetical protein
MAIPKLRTLKEWEAHFDGHIPVSTLRAEVQSGNLRGIRARKSCNAPILVSEDEMARWLSEVAGKRQTVLSPTETKAAVDAASPGASGDAAEAL